MTEQKERKMIENLANGTEQVAILVSSYYHALLEKGVPYEMVEKMVADCAHLYFEALFKSALKKSDES